MCRLVPARPLRLDSTPGGLPHRLQSRWRSRKHRSPGRFFALASSTCGPVASLWMPGPAGARRSTPIDKGDRLRIPMAKPSVQAPPAQPLAPESPRSGRAQRGRGGPGRGTGRSALARWLAALVWFGCTSQYQLQAPDGGNVVEAAAAGVKLRASANAWASRPRALTRYVVPIEVEVANNTASPLRLRYSDFTLADEQGYAVQALDPRKGGMAPERERVWGVGPWFGSAVGPGSARLRAVGYRRGPYRYPAPYRFWPGRAGAYGGVWPGAQPWGTLYAVDPRTALQVAQLGLAEGELLAGGNASGFLYFPMTAREASQLDLAWRVHEVEGKALGLVRASFQVRRGGD